MDLGIKLSLIPPKLYPAYKTAVIFKAFKWDPQVEDINTVARYSLLVSKKTVDDLQEKAEILTTEVLQLEKALLKKPELISELGLPKKVLNKISRIRSDKENDVRLMRFDFHPTAEGWRLSEVNSDVPAGLAENSALPKITQAMFPQGELGRNVVESLGQAFKKRLGGKANIALIHATAYADDRQIACCVADYFNQIGLHSSLVAPNHIDWRQRHAYLAGSELRFDGIYRHFPFEWLAQLSDKAQWLGYYDSLTPACNPAIAILSQSKRLPLLWDKLQLDVPGWRTMLPETKALEKKAGPGIWIYKPAYGRVGEGISINEAISEKERKKILKAVKYHKKYWVQQQKFNSEVLVGENNERFHLCLGVYTVCGKAAGFYGRISEYARIDERAQDIAVLIGE